MSVTALQVIERALTRMGVIQYGETPQDDEADRALSTLNDMLHAWQLDGIDLKFTDLSLTSVLPYPDNHTKPIVDNLVINLKREFGQDLRGDDVDMAENGYRNLQHYYARPKPLKFDPMLTYGVNRL